MLVPHSLPRRLAAWTTSLALLLVGISWSPAPATAQDQQVIDQIAAVVGGDIILQSEVENMARSMAQRSQRPVNTPLMRNALQQLIDQAVLADQAQQDTTITVSDQQVEDQVDRQVTQYARQVGGEERLEEMYGRSILEIKDDLREDVREQILAQQFRGRHMNTIDITPSEVQQWFSRVPQDSLPNLPTTVRLAHIVRYPKPSDDARQEAREIITTLRDSIVGGGADFAAMARQFSDDPGSAPDGGRISGVNLDDLVPEFAAVASRTPIGEVSQIFYNQAQEGFHILRVNDRSGGTIDFNHILIQVSRRSADPQQTIDHLQAVRDTLLNIPDVPFALMVRRHSEEDRSKELGGRVVDPQYGTRDLVLQNLGPSWRSTLDTMDVGAISQPTEVRLLNGDRAYHILKLQARTPAHRMNLETDYERIKEFALQEKQQREMRRWLDELREETYVDIRMTFDTATAVRRR